MIIIIIILRQFLNSANLHNSRNFQKTNQVFDINVFDVLDIYGNITFLRQDLNGHPATLKFIILQCLITGLNKQSRNIFGENVDDTQAEKENLEPTIVVQDDFFTHLIGEKEESDMLIDNDTNKESEDLQIQVSDDFDFEKNEENVEPRMQILENVGNEAKVNERNLFQDLSQDLIYSNFTYQTSGLQEENLIKFHQHRSYKGHVNVGELLKESFDLLNAENLDPEMLKPSFAFLKEKNLQAIDQLIPEKTLNESMIGSRDYIDTDSDLKS